MIFSVPALVALVGVAALALVPDGRFLSGVQMGPDRATLWFLVLCCLISFIRPIKTRLNASRDASTWAFLVAFFVLFHIADRGPQKELSDAIKAKYMFAPDTISYATILIVTGGGLSLLLGLSRWIKRGGPEKAIVTALALVGVLGFGLFYFLGNYFEIGSDKTLSPIPMATLLVQIIAYICLAICCRAATEDERIRPWVLNALPIVLLVVVLRHQLAPIPAPKDDE